MNNPITSYDAMTLRDELQNLTDEQLAEFAASLGEIVLAVVREQQVRLMIFQPKVNEMLH